MSAVDLEVKAQGLSLTDTASMRPRAMFPNYSAKFGKTAQFFICEYSRLEHTDGRR